MKQASWLSVHSLMPKLLTALRIAFLLLAINTILWMLILLVSVASDSPSPIPMYQVMFEVGKEGILQLSEHGKPIEFKMPVASGWIHAKGLPKGFDISYSLLRLLSVICILFSIRFTIKILETAEKGSFFVVENALRLRGIAILGFGILFFVRMSSLFSSFYLKDKLEFPGIVFTNFYSFTFVDFLLLLHFLFLLMIAEAFRKGALMKDENDLTI